MDPNANLDEQLALVARIKEIASVGQWTDLNGPLLDELMTKSARLVELHEALDHWLTGGGFLPSRWNEPRMERIR